MNVSPISNQSLNFKGLICLDSISDKGKEKVTLDSTFIQGISAGSTPNITKINYIPNQKKVQLQSHMI